MASLGRGRGYLGRHHTRDEPPRPGEGALRPPSPGLPPVSPIDTAELNGRQAEPAMKPPTCNRADSERDPSLDTDDEKALAELLLVEDKYRPIVVLLEQFSPGEDGIIFNRKLKELETALSTLCHDDNQLMAAFSSLRGAALCNAATARKLATVGASFTRQQKQNVLRRALLNIMQGTFAKLDVLERANPQILTNAATLMGDYFTEARLSNGSKVHMLCVPLLQYMRSLLASSDRRAHRALATQLMQNGRELLTTNAQELEELSISVRRRILSSGASSAVWLLLCADLCINKFLPLPPGLQTFYAASLDLLPERDQHQYSEVSYGSWKKEEEVERREELEKGVQQMSVSSDDGSGRKLRPILGAGARQNTSLSESSQGSAAPSNIPQEVPEVYNKSSLAKRYDLNSWRQQENDEKSDSQDELSTSYSSDKFIQSQQFTNENYKDFETKNPPFYSPNERFSNPPPFVPPDGNFTTPPPPFTPANDKIQNSYERSTSVDGKYQFHDRRSSQESGGNRLFTALDCGNKLFATSDVGNKPFTSPDGGNKQFMSVESSGNKMFTSQDCNKKPFISQGKDIGGNKKVQETNNPGQDKVQRLNPNERLQQRTQDRLVPGVPERTDDYSQNRRKESVSSESSPPEKQTGGLEKNFQSGDRPRRPPENWRKDKPKDDQSRKNWGRQKSKEIEEPEEVKSDDKVGFRDGAGDSKSFNRRRDGRTRRKTEDSEEAPVKPPQRRHAMEVPRGKYWDHDDRLDKDYNS